MRIIFRLTGEEIKAIREDLGLTRPTLALWCGVDKQTIRRAEAGFITLALSRLIDAIGKGYRPLE